MDLKIEVARRQLGVATDMFIRDSEPVSIQSLASSAGEILDHFARKTGRAFSNAFLDISPDYDLAKLRRVQRVYWNAFKHPTRKQGKEEVERDDEELIAEFDDGENAAVLFTAWMDYSVTTGAMPIEAQVFQAWYYALDPEGRHEMREPGTDKDLFPRVRDRAPSRRKTMLRRRIEWARGLKDVMKSPATERRPLILPWPPTILTDPRRIQTAGARRALVSDACAQPIAGIE